MKIVIVGAGALGRLLGAYLSTGGQEIFFIEPDSEVMNAINEKGIGVASRESQGPELLQYYPAHAVAHGQEIQQCDLLFMTVKSYDTHDATHQIAHLVGPNSPVITLQNGLGHLEIMEKICAPADIVSGFTNLGGTALGPGEVMDDGIGTTYLGHRHKNSAVQLAGICTMLNESGIPAREVTDIVSRRWNRVLVHAAINPVSALLRCCNNHLLNNMHSLSLMKRLVDEGRDIAGALGVDLGDVDHYEMLFAACRNRPEHLSPMLQDIINNRKTEVDALNGILCQYARKTGVSANSHVTTYELMKSLEKEVETVNFQKERF
jgi:2-dehydropantoate 2-reductase